MDSKEIFSLENVIKVVGEATKAHYGINPYEPKIKTLNDFKTSEERIAFLEGEKSGIKYAESLIDQQLDLL